VTRRLYIRYRLDLALHLLSNHTLLAPYDIAEGASQSTAMDVPIVIPVYRPEKPPQLDEDDIEFLAANTALNK